MATPNAVAVMLAYFHELYPTRNVEQQTAVAWEWALEDVPDDKLLWAAKQITREPGRQFFPTPNEVRDHLMLSREQAPRLANPDDPVGKSVDDWYAGNKVKDWMQEHTTPRKRP